MTVVIEGLVVPPDFDLTPGLDAALNRLAHRAKEEAAARNTLYEAFAFKIERFARRCARRATLHACEPADVEQEAFLVFCELVQRWQGKASFAGYFFTWFPEMLRQAIARLEHGRPAGTLALDDVDPAAAPEPALLLVDDIVSLSERELLVLELRVTAGLQLREIAALLGCHPRTVRRILHRIRHRLADAGNTAQDSGTNGPSASGSRATSGSDRQRMDEPPSPRPVGTPLPPSGRGAGGEGHRVISRSLMHAGERRSPKGGSFR